MANYRIALTADTAATLLCDVHKPRSLDDFFATLNAYGGFGSGTLSYLLSTDGGTTKTTMKDISGSAYSTTAADAVNVAMGVANHNTSGQIVQIYAALSGSTNPTLTIDVLTNT